MNELKPLVPLVDMPGRKMECLPLSSEEYDDETRSKLVHYLETAPLVVPWMSETEDMLGNRFEPVAGGLAVMSDGVWYWRYDAAQYVRHYPVRIPEEASTYFRSNGWEPPRFDAERLDEMTLEMYRLFRW